MDIKEYKILSTNMDIKEYRYMYLSENTYCVDLLLQLPMIIFDIF